MQGVRAFIALGANLGKPLAQLDSAVLALDQHDKVNCIAMSKVYVSKPHGVLDQPNFTNAVAEIYTTLSAEALLTLLQTLEARHGRQRISRWGARTLDLDLILYANHVINTPRLSVPHPRAHEREFVLQPLLDLDSTLSLPQQGSVQQLLQQLPNKSMEIIRDVTTYYRQVT